MKHDGTTLLLPCQPHTNTRVRRSVCVCRCNDHVSAFLHLVFVKACFEHVFGCLLRKLCVTPLSGPKPADLIKFYLLLTLFFIHCFDFFRISIFLFSTRSCEGSKDYILMNKQQAMKTFNETHFDKLTSHTDLFLFCLLDGLNSPIAHVCQ